MRRLHRSQALAYVLGVLTAGGGLAVGAAWAGHAAAGDTTIHACVQKGNGGFYQSTDGACKKGDQPIEWSIQGPQGIQGPKGEQGATGPAGSGLNHAVSPNGAFTITIGNTGITLKGPSGKVIVDFQGAHVLTAGG